MKRILVTGGAGFIGSHLVDRLIELGYQVAVVDNLSRGTKENVNAKAAFFRADIETASLENIFKKIKPEIVFHFAARINATESLSCPIEYVTTNVWGTVHMLECCKKYQVKKIIFASSCAVYGPAKKIPTSESYEPHPISPYAITKLTAEKYCSYYFNHARLPYVSLRLANVYGPRQQDGVIAIFCKKIVSGKKLTLYGNGKQTRDFTYVADVVNAAVLAMQSAATGVFNVGTGNEVSIHDLCDNLQKIANIPLKKEYRLTQKEPLQRSCLDCSNAKKILHWQADTIFEEGMKKTFHFYQS
jgi:UDP-glucose 4-epimerase